MVVAAVNVALPLAVGPILPIALSAAGDTSRKPPNVADAYLNVVTDAVD